VLRETTNRGLCGLGCPSRTSERGGEGDCVKGGGGEEGKCERSWWWIYLEIFCKLVRDTVGSDRLHVAGARNAVSVHTHQLLRRLPRPMLNHVPAALCLLMRGTAVRAPLGRADTRGNIL
jgi:hypothetical protein